MYFAKKKPTPTRIDPPPYIGSILSPESLGETPTNTFKKPSYFSSSDEETKRTRGYFMVYGKKIAKLKWARPSLRYPQLIGEPVLRWYPSRYKTFRVAKKVDDFWVMTLIPEKYNPSFWKDRKGFVCVRVAPNVEYFIKKLFKKYGLWYYRPKNVWKKRYNFETYPRISRSDGDLAAT